MTGTTRRADDRPAATGSEQPATDPVAAPPAPAPARGEAPTPARGEAGATEPAADGGTSPEPDPAKKATPKKATATKKATVAKQATSTKKAAAAKKATPAKRSASAKKATAAKQATSATQPGASQPDPPVAVVMPVTPAPVAAQAASGTGPTAWLDVRILDHPGYAPELLALAAVRVLGPEAEAWARRTRIDYPAATPHGLARLATRRFVRLAAAGNAASAVAGAFAPFAALSTLAWTQARLVLHLAAAFGEDATAVDRAAELLVLTRVHPDEASARDALRTAREAPQQGEAPLHRVAEAGWRLAAPLALRLPGWLALRYAARRLPGVLLLAATAAGSADTERLAARAIAHYRAR